MNKAIKEYLSQIGAKGGRTGGKSKARGGKDYYRRISRLGVLARKRNQQKRAKGNQP